jgi:hypothetical protein
MSPCRGALLFPVPERVAAFALSAAAETDTVPAAAAPPTTAAPRMRFLREISGMGNDLQVRGKTN